MTLVETSKPAAIMQKTVICYNEPKVQSIIESYRPVIAKCNNILRLYNTLGLDGVPKNFLADVRYRGIDNVRALYDRFILSEISRMGIKVRSQILTMQDHSNDLLPLTSAIIELQNTMDRSDAAIENLEVHDDKARLSEKALEEIRAMYSVELTTEKDHRLYDSLLSLKKAWDNVIMDVKDYGHSLNQWTRLCSESEVSLVSEDADHNLKINLGHFKFIQTHKK